MSSTGNPSREPGEPLRTALAALAGVDRAGKELGDVDDFEGVFGLTAGILRGDGVVLDVVGRTR